MDAIRRYLTGDDGPEGLARAVKALLARHGGRDLQAALDDPLDCAGCRARLPAFALDLELDRPPNSHGQAVAHHLGHCEDCAGQLAELLALDRLAAPDNEPAPVPAPDLAFLAAAAAPSPAGPWQRIGATRHRLATEIRASVSRTAARFDPLAGGLAGQPLALPALRGDAVGTGERLELPVDGPLQIELALVPLADRARLTVTLRDPATGAPPPQATVSLLDAQGRVRQRIDADADGRASLTDLATGRHTLALRTPGGQWEIALDLRPGEG
jgi:hypothetical protein